jgi:hypothetical protein
MATGTPFKIISTGGPDPVRRIHMFLGLLDPQPDPLVTSTDADADPDQAPDPSLF